MPSKLGRTQLRKLITAAIDIANSRGKKTDIDCEAVIIRVLLQNSLKDVPASEMRKTLLGPKEEGWA